MNSSNAAVMGNFEVIKFPIAVAFVVSAVIE